VSAIVRRFLTEFAAEESEFERLKRWEGELRDRIRSFSAADRLSREAAHSLSERRRRFFQR
jgi:hypothetical protein